MERFLTDFRDFIANCQNCGVFTHTRAYQVDNSYAAGERLEYFSLAFIILLELWSRQVLENQDLTEEMVPLHNPGSPF